ncbi:hypothetical protein Val02_88100 [Virgisporangium aliadipatigenens]|uniref:TraD/TraG TraM recognition site domain-containing protein n=2 Tax=Virgisporangium aliadipatigenens TaxID=741659 RepID=A0A8J4DVL0_9ACTN|nr:hypothetical protein Val02_88100 [Virgisporangium aliadipatigenens]
MPRGATTGQKKNSDGFALVLPIIGIFALVIVLGGLLWLAGQLSAVLTGNGWPASSGENIGNIVKLWAQNPGDPAAAWLAVTGARSGPLWLILFIFLVLLSPFGYAGFRGVQFALNWRRRRESRRFRLGFASGNEIRKTLGVAAMRRKAGSVRPSTKGKKNVDPKQVGFYLGRDVRSRQEIYGSVEDVFIVLAPPRQGKDVHFCAPYTIDAPGAAIVTSTRADAFTNTYAMRAKLGKVLVFDPNGMTNWPEKYRWSLVAGAENPRIATSRATAVIIGAGFSTDGAGAFYTNASISALRMYLHAAAVGRKTMRDVMRWATKPTSPEPVDILRHAEAAGAAVKGWGASLEALANGEAQMVGATWSKLVQALACFSDPNVLDACSPEPDEVLDMEEFLAGQNTLYILGKEQKGGGVAPIVTAMMEDMFDQIRKIASKMPGSRLDPPLTVELNEAAHIAPMPNLPGYMGDSGGFSISLHVYLQSLSQARSKWGVHEAMIMWDNAAIRVIMGGAGNVEDLEDVSRLMGEVRDPSGKTSRHEGRRVLSPEEIRTLPFGTAVVVARASRPVEVSLTPWWKRKDAKQIGAGKSKTEKMVLQYTEEAERHDPAKQYMAQLAAGGTGAPETPVARPEAVAPPPQFPVQPMPIPHQQPFPQPQQPPLPQPQQQWPGAQHHQQQPPWPGAAPQQGMPPQGMPPQGMAPQGVPQPGAPYQPAQSPPAVAEHPFGVGYPAAPDSEATMPIPQYMPWQPPAPPGTDTR